jgi:5-methyltetrahydrofolate corrinoid/iron sulfur protein methyltransferase
MLIVGERINATRKKIGEAVQNQDAEHIKAEAVKQVEAGAHMIDVNGGIPGKETEYLLWLVDLVQGAVDVPLCLDSADANALAAALPQCNEPPLINSITYEKERLAAVTPLVKEHGAKVIALCLSDEGPPQDYEGRIEIAARLVDRLTGDGIPLENIYVDPCVFPISTNSETGTFVLDAISWIHEQYPGVHTICGASNVSFGLPMRKILNATFLAMLIARGLDSAIIDPCNTLTRACVLAAEALAGHDEFCTSYIGAFRAGQLEV